MYNNGSDGLLSGDMYIPMPALVKDVRIGEATNGYPTPVYEKSGSVPDSKVE